MIVKKFKILSLALIFSCALNIGLIGAFIYFVAEKSSPSEKKGVITANGQMLYSMSRLSFRELVSYLTNREQVKEGYTKRDLALAVLVGFHHFNLEKALSAPCPSKALLLTKDQTIDVFPGLTEEQFEAIIRFAYQEKWPLTAKGLFTLLQNQKNGRDESLEQAFFLTPEFYALQILFQKTNTPQEPQVLLGLAMSSSWECFDKLQTQVGEFSEEKRRSLLLKCLTFHSKEAAILLLKTDLAYALKDFDDKQILDLLSLLKKRSDEGSRFCIELLRTNKTDAIHQAAALTLYSYAGEMPPLPIDPQTVLTRFASTVKPVSPTLKPAAKIETPPSSSNARFHVVKEGETLWKISRQYQVKVDEIVRMNRLENHSLFPGMTLKLPQ